jgi:hypothetical protein
MSGFAEFGEALATRYPLAVALGLGAAAVAVLFAFRRTPRAVRIGRVASPLGAAATLAVAVLGASAFQAVLRGAGLHGWPLLAHVVAGGAFVVLIALFSLAALPALLRTRGEARPDAASRLGIAGALLCGAIAAASVFASMFALVGGTAFERLLDAHRWAGLGAFVLTMLTAARIARRPHAAAGQSQAKQAAVTSA